MKTTPCPHCGKPISPASLLGQTALGIRKAITAKEATRRRKSLTAARLARWKNKSPKPLDSKPLS